MLEGPKLFTQASKRIPLKPVVSAGLGRASVRGASRSDVAGLPRGAQGAHVGMAPASGSEEPAAQPRRRHPGSSSPRGPSGTRCIYSWWPCKQEGQVALRQDSSLRELGAVLKREAQSHGWVCPVSSSEPRGGRPQGGRQMCGGSEGRGFPPASSSKWLSHRA